ncbi:MAG: TonB-dependent receptor [Acidobacteriota bacterium]|nr:TonB-dependent receptor [Acidobacteriota bacterium]
MAGLLRSLLLLLLSALCLQAVGQQALSARGILVDPSGAGIAGAVVRLETHTGDLVRSTVSEGQGAFTFTNLPAGDYTLSVPAFTGFAQRSLPLHLTGNLSGIKVLLKLQSVQQEMTVGADQAISTDPSANRDTVSVSTDELRKLPAFDQDYVGLLSSFVDPGAGGVTLVVDGIEMKSAGVSPSAIQEVRLNNDPYSTEFTRPGRGRIEITTKPGSPQFHGEFNFIFRDAVFNANNAFATTRPPEVRRLFEGHLSGPAARDRHTDFIASGEFGQRNTAAIVNALTAAGPLSDTVITPRRNAQGTLRVTHDFSSSHRLQVGYNFEYDTSQNAGVGGLVLREAGYNNVSREDDAIFNDRIILSPNLIQQLMVTFEKDEDVIQSVTQAPSVQVNGYFTAGGAQQDVSRTENTVHINEVVSWSHGRHYLRFGGQAPQISRRASDDRTNRLGTYGFNTLADFNNKLAHTFTVQQGPGRGLYWINEIGAFVQDQVKVSPHLQVSLGVRYDWQTYVDDVNNFAPRASLAYAPGKGKTVLRVGSGVFYDRTGGDFPITVKLHNGSVLDSVQLLDQPYPLAAGTPFASVPSNIVRFAPNARSPYTVQSSFTVERLLNKKLTASAGYRNAVQVGSFRSRDANAPVLPPNASLGANYARPNAAFGQIQQIESGGRQTQNAMDLALRGRTSRWFSGQVQYTLGRTMNNTGGINSFPEDQYRPNDEWGRAGFDRLHALNIIGTIYPDHWLSLGINASLYSGSPYNETAGVDYFHTGFSNARPAGVPRNSLQGSGTANFDVLWEHEFQLTKAKGDEAKVLSTGLAAFNVLNHPNYSGYIGSLSSTRFEQPTTAAAGRQIQFSVGYRF